MIKLAKPEASLLLAAALRQSQLEAYRDPTGVYAVRATKDERLLTEPIYVIMGRAAAGQICWSASSSYWFRQSILNTRFMIGECSFGSGRSVDLATR